MTGRNGYKWTVRMDDQSRFAAAMAREFGSLKALAAPKKLFATMCPRTP